VVELGLLQKVIIQLISLESCLFAASSNCSERTRMLKMHITHKEPKYETLEYIGLVVQILCIGLHFTSTKY